MSFRQHCYVWIKQVGLRSGGINYMSLFWFFSTKQNSPIILLWYNLNLPKMFHNMKVRKWKSALHRMKFLKFVIHLWFGHLYVIWKATSLVGQLVKYLPKLYTETVFCLQRKQGFYFYSVLCTDDWIILIFCFIWHLVRDLLDRQPIPSQVQKIHHK